MSCESPFSESCTCVLSRIRLFVAPPGSNVCGIFQARILEWVAISYSRGLSQSRNQTRIFCTGGWVLLPLCHLGSPDPIFLLCPHMVGWVRELPRDSFVRSLVLLMGAPLLGSNQIPNTMFPEVKWSEVKSLCPTLCDPVDCSQPGSSVHGIFQARVLEWGANPVS